MGLIKDILDMEDYLKNRCYCPGEIYSSDGFFYQIFKPENECEIVGECEDYIVIVATVDMGGRKPQLIIIYKGDDGKVADTVRYVATENNITIFKKILSGISVQQLKSEGVKFDEYINGSTAKSLKEIMCLADAIIVD